jgi:Tfp pilus assembly protein PilF
MKRSMATALVLVVCGMGAKEARAQGAMVRGQVVDEQGEPLADVRVELQYTGRDPQTFVRKTNKKGSFVQVGLPSGPYKILYSKDGYTTVAHATNITAGGLTEVPQAMLEPAPTVVKTPEGDVVDVGKKIEETYAKATQAAQAGRLDEAEALYEEILEEAPDLAVARYNLGYIHQQKEDWPAAEAEYRRVVELEPDRADTYSALAAVLEATDRREEALEILAAASSRFAEDATFQFNLGVTYMNAGNNELAAEAFRKARELDPTKVEAGFYLGTLAIGAAKLEEAITLLEAYVSASGQNPQNLATAQKLIESLGPAQE